MHKAPVRVVRLLLLVHRPLPGVLDAQAGGNDDHFAQRLLRARFQDHAPHRRVDGQPGEFTANGREHAHRVRHIV